MYKTFFRRKLFHSTVLSSESGKCNFRTFACFRVQVKLRINVDVIEKPIRTVLKSHAHSLHFLYIKTTCLQIG